MYLGANFPEHVCFILYSHQHASHHHVDIPPLRWQRGHHAPPPTLQPSALSPGTLPQHLVSPALQAHREPAGSPYHWQTGPVSSPPGRAEKIPQTSASGLRSRRKICGPVGRHSCLANLFPRLFTRRRAGRWAWRGGQGKRGPSLFSWVSISIISQTKAGAEICMPARFELLGPLGLGMAK